MLYTLKNNENLIYSYMEWNVVDYLGNTSNEGRYLFIRDLWVHPDYKGGDLINEFIVKLDNDKMTKYVRWIYWEREIETDGKTYQRKSKLFKRETCLRRILKLMQEV